jgi:hypothetical protein
MDAGGQGNGEDTAGCVHEDADRLQRVAHDVLCVQQRLACLAGVSPAGVEIRSPIAWIAGRRETELSEAYRQVFRKGRSESAGRNESERGCGLENGLIRRPSPQYMGESSMDGRNLIDATVSLRRG